MLFDQLLLLGAFMRPKVPQTKIVCEATPGCLRAESGTTQIQSDQYAAMHELFIKVWFEGLESLKRKVGVMAVRRKAGSSGLISHFSSHFLINNVAVCTTMHTYLHCHMQGV